MSFRDDSKLNYGAAGNVAMKGSIEALNCGALLRIADAVEVMSSNYRNLLNERDQYQRWWKEEAALRARAQKQIRALRGVITTLKRKNAQLTITTKFKIGDLLIDKKGRLLNVAEIRTTTFVGKASKLTMTLVEYKPESGTWRIEKELKLEE